MNKKRLAALAMSAVMAAGTVSIPVNAADFSDGAAVQEATAEAETLTVDVVEEETPDAVAAEEAKVDTEREITFDEKNDKVLYYLVGVKDQQSKAATRVDYTEATCEKNATYKLQATLEGNYTATSNPIEVEGTALEHNWQSKTVVIYSGDCTQHETKPEGMRGYYKLTYTGDYCDNCEQWKEDEATRISKATKSEPDHKYVGEKITRNENADNVIFDANGNPVLKNKEEKGTYDIVTYQKCEICGQLVELSREQKTISATDATEGKRVVIETTNIMDDSVKAGMLLSDVPAEDKILLKDCSKDGSYKVEVAVGEDSSYTYDVTVKAHHVAKTTIEEVNAKDKGILVAHYDKDGNLTSVTNGTCDRDIPYYEIQTCVAGCKKEISKVEKVAPKSTNHVYNTEKYASINKGKNEAVDVKSLGADDKTIKLVTETPYCETEGSVTVEFYCQVCGEKVATISGVKVKALGHHENAYRVENEVDATCEKAGTYDLVTYCELCGKDLKKVTVTGKKLPHTNETAVGVSNDTDKGSDVFIDFVGSKVYQKLTAGQVIDGNTVGDGAGKLTANVYTNCAVCHNNEQRYVKGNENVTLTVVNVVNETYGKVDGETVVTKLGTVTVKASYITSEGKTVTAETSVPYLSDPAKADDVAVKVGLVKDKDGVYRYYINDEFIEDYAGIAEYGDGEFFVANGLLCKDANGLNLYDGTWYMLANGQIQRDYNGLALYDGQWFYLTNGELDEEINGIVNYDGGQFLVINGRLGGEVNGLWQNIDGDWYYLANGQVQNQYTGVAQYDGAFFYVVNGVLDSDYNGTVEYDGETFKVVNGMLQ